MVLVQRIPFCRAMGQSRSNVGPKFGKEDGDEEELRKTSTLSLLTITWDMVEVW